MPWPPPPPPSPLALLLPDMTAGACRGAAPGGGAGPLLIVHAATSSTYPLTLMEGWNHNLEFFKDHPAPFTISPGRPLPRMTEGFEPSEARVRACRAWTHWKVWAVCSILRLLGKMREARKLEVGFEAFCVHNRSETDFDLTFSTKTLVALESLLHPEERRRHLLVWRPVLGRNGGGAAAGGAEALAPIAGDVCWQRYLHTQMAGIYCMLFGVEAPRNALKAEQAATEENRETAGAAGGKLRVPQRIKGKVVDHDFVRIR